MRDGMGPIGFLRSVAVALLLFAGAVHLCVRASCVSDSLQKEALDERLAEYFAAIEHESLQVKSQECDFLIGSCTDSLMRQYVALAVYDRYSNSRLMGDEGVAIHVFDKWFRTGKVRMRSEADMLGAKVFAEFNRMSLLGCQAPDMTLYDMEYRPVDLSEAGKGRFRILYFYDTSCASCRMQTILLRNILEEGDFPVDFYAVYVSDDEDAWKEYVMRQLDIREGRTRVMHLWDPEMNSDFQRKYGVIQTPRMFLVGPDGTILGRGLDSKALGAMLYGIFNEKELVYGGEDSVRLFDEVFGESPSRQDIVDISGYIAESTLGKGDTLMFRQMTGDLLYYLGSHRGEGVKEGLSYVVDEMVFPRGEIWRSRDDSLKIVSYAEMLRDLLSLSVPGSMVADLKVPATLLSSSGKARASEFRLRHLKGRRNIIIFYTDGCHICDAEKEAAAELVIREKGVKVLLVNVDDVLADSLSSANVLFDSFDLSSLPFIIETDRKGRILRRYISLQK